MTLHKAFHIKAEPNVHAIGPSQRAPKAPPGFYYMHRHGFLPIGTQPPETQVPACPRHPVAKLPPGLIPQKYIEALEQNQQIASCCRHPENHDIEAFKSHPDETVPDIYVFHCDQCGRKHRRFCVGGGDVRPFWEVR